MYGKEIFISCLVDYVMNLVESFKIQNYLKGFKGYLE